MWKRLKPYVEAAATVRGSGSGPFVLETATPCDRGYQLLYRRCCSRIFWCPTSACRCCLVSSQTAPARRASPLRSCSGCCHRVHGCSPHTSGCSPEYMRSRPPTHTVAATPPPTAAACATYGYSLRHLRLQPAPPTVAACTTHGCRCSTRRSSSQGHGSPTSPRPSPRTCPPPTVPPWPHRRGSCSRSPPPLPPHAQRACTAWALLMLTVWRAHAHVAGRARALNAHHADLLFAPVLTDRLHYLAGAHPRAGAAAGVAAPPGVQCARARCRPVRARGLLRGDPLRDAPRAARRRLRARRARARGARRSFEPVVLGVHVHRSRPYTGS